MMKVKDRVDDIKRRIARRRKERNPMNGIQSRNGYYPLPKDEERFGEAPFLDYEHSSKSDQPLFRKDILMLQILLAVSLFLVVGILFKDASPRWEKARSFINEAMENEFQFATILNWYEEQFGQPVALLPTPEEVQQIEQRQTQYVNRTEDEAEPVYAVPAAGRVLEPFSKDGQGIMVETGRDSSIEAINEGVVVYAGVKDDIGKTVIIQHSDGTETWYGSLESINVKLYDFVKSRTQLGKVTNTKDGQAGTFYFAYKKGDTFIDPKQVINFD